jgi:hypothetical protein
MRFRMQWLAAAALVLTAESGLLADVLVLRDGTRIDGVLVAVRGDVIEFEQRTGYGSGRVRRYDRADVRAIQFDDYRSDLRDDPRRDEGRPRAGMRERSVDVQARTGWTDTGVDVRAGQEIFFAPTGEVRWGPGRRDGAAGERNSPRNPGRPMPDRNAAALIGRIGENGDPFFIGDDRGGIRVRGSGRLYLGINDDYLQDNTGWFRVVIAY